MAELRETHLGSRGEPANESDAPSVLAQLQAAYEAVVARNRQQDQTEDRPAASQA